MFAKQQDAHAQSSEPDPKRPDMNRRNFLRATAASATALTALPALTTAGCVPVQDPEQNGGKVSTGVEGNDQKSVQKSRSDPLVTTKSSKVVETWNEPWTWKVGDWPGQQLPLTVIENQNPGAVIGDGNIGQVLFSYGGSTPGPTIRMKGDETLYVKLRNLLGEDHGETYVGYNPKSPSNVAKEKMVDGLFPDYCLGEHTNGLHSAHVTNLHVHGLHVRPATNPDGTHSDNVLLRVMPHADYRQRMNSDDVSCRFLRDLEQVGEADFEFILGNVLKKYQVPGAPAPDPHSPQPHPPGTHWYHPHSHGATHTQVSSGMAGFLVVEGDVDEALNDVLAGAPNPDPTRKTGDYDYCERMIFMQSLKSSKVEDPDAPKGSGDIKGAAVNGSPQPQIITMQPGAVERWRILNGSVDGAGYKRFMVLKGQLDYDPKTKLLTTSGETASLKTIEDAKQNIYQLAMDGVTLVMANPDGTGPEYTIKDLSKVNPTATDTPLPTDYMQSAAENLRHFNDCFANERGVKNCFVRPNEVYLAPANRVDLLFQAPPLADPNNTPFEIYTVVARSVAVHFDNYQASIQGKDGKGKDENGKDFEAQPVVPDLIVAYIIVKGDAVAGLDTLANGNLLTKLQDALPDVPAYHYPILPSELAAKEAEAEARSDVTAGYYRTRTITYSGWGHPGQPVLTTRSNSDDTDPTKKTAENFLKFVKADLAEHEEDPDKSLEYLIYEPVKDSNGEVSYYKLLQPEIRTMAINGYKFDPDPGNFAPAIQSQPLISDPKDDTNPVFIVPPQMYADSAEEWALFNSSITLWGDGGTRYPLTRQQAAEHDLIIQTKALDHPFHMHQNPFWVMRIEVPDAEGNLINILDEPRWQDVVWIPRSGGRVVFRSRFPDYVGMYVEHCHVLQHEDNGMMQVVNVTEDAAQTNYVAQDPNLWAEGNIDTIFPPPSPEKSYRQSSCFVDPNPNTGQNYPGFVVMAPKLPSE